MSIEGTSAFSRSDAHLDVKRSIFFPNGTVQFIQKLDARKFYKDGINNILVALIQTHIEAKSTPFLLDQ